MQIWNKMGNIINHQIDCNDTITCFSTKTSSEENNRQQMIEWKNYLSYARHFKYYILHTWLWVWWWWKTIPFGIIHWIWKWYCRYMQLNFSICRLWLLLCKKSTYKTILTIGTTDIVAIVKIWSLYSCNKLLTFC